MQREFSNHSNNSLLCDDILSEIILNKQNEIKQQMEAVSISELENILNDNGITGNSHDNGVSSGKGFVKSILSSPAGIIAEFKRRSPSKGWINRNAEVAPTIKGYAEAGASAISVLTDGKFFGGSMNDLIVARKATDIPVLRKDFIISEYQLYQSRLIGADAVLLIAAALTKEKCKALAVKAKELGLEVLLELHSEKELYYLEGNMTDYIDIIGINNRDLGSFHTDIENSFRMAGKLPGNIPLVSESGISDYKDILRLRSVGFSGFLIGESFMRNSIPHESFAQFTERLAEAKYQDVQTHLPRHNCDKALSQLS